ncbi:MAG: hypothetical protein ACXABK_00660 [Candidatus Heimdallarchaeaceae archaeon]|jgi:hypothetical protein
MVSEGVNVEEVEDTEETLDRIATLRSESEVLGDWSKGFLKWLGKKIHSPMGIYFIVTWVLSILTMGVTNTLRGGSFLDGPRYWMDVFLTYGLNAGQDSMLRFIAKPFLVWLFAPMVVLMLGFTLFMLTDSGFFRNGADPVAELDFNQSHRFFSIDNIWGSSKHINGSSVVLDDPSPKWTLTYFWIVWFPIIIGAIVAAIYNFIIFKKIKKERYLPKPRNFLLITFVASFVIGLQMALMTGNIGLSFRQLFYSLFVERVQNNFLIYGFEYGGQGQYHPIALTIVIWLLYLVIFLMVYFIFIILGNMDNIWKNLDYPYRRVVNYINARKAPDLSFEEKVNNFEIENS